ncbi:P-loop containing nucleoside triphosphate hydrolase protein [Obelidium mucronatum]|nr:P-loop containing nucleoside triphosphate hydrolase protein [Obelidium mucronatum]
MGPSGAGKSTLLDVLAGRKGNVGAIKGTVFLNGLERPIKKYSCYVTQDDSLIGCFTVRETVRWAVELNLPVMIKKNREEKVHAILSQFGLMKCADSIVGDAILKGISDGEKRRLSIAIQMVKEPKVIFLDEPTTGLDSAASFKVMEAIKDLAKRQNCTIVCSIHQPSPSTYALFDKVLFLARGQTVYFGDSHGAEAEYFKNVGYEIPIHMNVPDAVLDYINVDFLGNEELASSHIERFVQSWANSDAKAQALASADLSISKGGDSSIATVGMVVGAGDYVHSFLKQTEILTRRNFSNASKSILLFWVRMIMYSSFAVLMGTTWFRMPLKQNYVQDRLSAIFLSIAFLVFMSVAGIPAVLEERAVFYRERLNRTYSVGAYVAANTLVSIPFIFLIALGFTLPGYWLMGLNPGAGNFFIYLVYLWLALYVAESLVIFTAAVLPIFVAALTLFKVSLFRPENIPAFWKYAFHYWDYQKWAWEPLIANEFVGLTFQCEPKPSGTGCFCSFPSSLGPDSCTFSGEDVIADLGYGNYSYWKSAVVLVSLIIFFRLTFYLALRLKKPKV